MLNLGSAPGSHRCGPRACAKSSTDPWQDERWHQTLKNRILLDSCYLPGGLEGQNTILPVFFHEPRGEVRSRLGLRRWSMRRLVILSACNTAAGGAASAEVLSGVARAFIYAGGARSWPRTGRLISTPP